uniref:K Homology domain-containing protein n=1 Tax=Alexandrium monilatum TaxID=311494 RepID=A0A7S4Q631_9DINO
MGAEESTEAHEEEDEEASGSDAEEAEEGSQQGQVSGAESAEEPAAQEAEPEPPDKRKDSATSSAVKHEPSEPPSTAAEAPEVGRAEPREPIPKERDPRLDALGAADDFDAVPTEPVAGATSAEGSAEAAEAPPSPAPPEEPTVAASHRSSSPSEQRASSSHRSRERSRSPAVVRAGAEVDEPAAMEVDEVQEAEETKAPAPVPEVRTPPPPPPPPKPEFRSPSPPPEAPKERSRSRPSERGRRRSEVRRQASEERRPVSEERRPVSEERRPVSEDRRKARPPSPPSPPASRRRRRWRDRSRRCSTSPEGRRSRSVSRRRAPRRRSSPRDSWPARRRGRRRTRRERRSRSRSRSASASRSRSRSSSWGSWSRQHSRSRSRTVRRSCPRRRSNSYRRSPTPREDPDALVLRFIPAEAAFLTGKNHGMAVKNIARASNTEAKLSHNNRKLTITGSERDRARAKRYVGFVLAQMDRPVHLEDTDIDDDCSMVQVPDVTVGYVTGANGAHLRRVEEEWGVVMMFAEYSGRLVSPATGSGPIRRCETLAIFGPRRGRRGTQLTMMNVIEGKVPRHFSAKIRAIGDTYHVDEVSDEWGTSTLEVREEIMPYALGKNGGTRRKLMLASGCIVQYLGNYAVMSGTKEEQTRATEYLTWLLQTLDGPVHVENLETRSDVTVVDVPGRIVGFIKGTRRESLSRHEEDWGVLMLFVGEHGQRGFAQQEGVVNLLIFGNERSRKGAEIDIMCAMEFKQKGWCTSRMNPRCSERQGFDVERIMLTEVEVSYALGMKGETRKKLAAASGAIIQFVGTVCCIAGERPERQRCKDYVGWLLGRLKGQTMIDTRGRTDVTEIHVGAPNSQVLGAKAMGVVTGKKGHTLQGVAKETGTWCVVAKDHNGHERLCIFGHVQGSWTGDVGRRKAERLFRTVLKEARGFAEADRRRASRRLQRENDPQCRGWRSCSGEGRGPGQQDREDSRPRSGSSRSDSSSPGGRASDERSRSRSRAPMRWRGGKGRGKGRWGGGGRW